MRGITLIAVLLLFFVSKPSHANPITALTKGTVTITVTDEPCGLRDRVELPNRITWAEGPKVYEGCAGKYGPFLIGYFDDKSIALIPIQDLKPAKAI